MSFLNSQSSVVQRKNDLVQIAQATLNALMNGVRVSFDVIWNDPNFTPQQVLDQFGTDAASLFIISQKSQELIKLLNPNWEPLKAPYNFVVNQDGSVTVGEKIETAPQPIEPEAPAEENQGEPVPEGSGQPEDSQPSEGGEVEDAQS